MAGNSSVVSYSESIIATGGIPRRVTPVYRTAQQYRSHNLYCWAVASLVKNWTLDDHVLAARWSLRVCTLRMRINPFPLSDHLLNWLFDIKNACWANAVTRDRYFGFKTRQFEGVSTCKLWWISGCRMTNHFHYHKFTSSYVYQIITVYIIRPLDN
jgi:hypothetical protein